MWFLVHGLIVFAVCATNIHWHWTPNMYVPALIGFVLALVVTGVTNELRDWVALRRSRDL